MASTAFSVGADGDSSRTSLRRHVRPLGHLTLPARVKALGFTSIATHRLPVLLVEHSDAVDDLPLAFYAVRLPLLLLSRQASTSERLKRQSLPRRNAGRPSRSMRATTCGSLQRRSNATSLRVM